VNKYGKSLLDYFDAYSHTGLLVTDAVIPLTQHLQYER